MSVRRESHQGREQSVVLFISLGIPRPAFGKLGASESSEHGAKTMSEELKPLFTHQCRDNARQNWQDCILVGMDRDDWYICLSAFEGSLRSEPFKYRFLLLLSPVSNTGIFVTLRSVVKKIRTFLH